MTTAAGDRRIPLHIVTGSLGSGKTTYLRRAQESGALAGALLLVNEAAAFGVDDRLLRSDSTAVALLANGCLCCRMDRGVKEELHRVLALHRARGDFDRAVLELSGLADPLAVIATIVSDPFLDGQLRIALVVTLVDCLHDAQSVGTVEHRRQIAAADIVLLTKMDLTTPQETAAAAARAAALQPLAPCLSAADTAYDGLVAQAGQLRADRLAHSAFLAATGRFACRPPDPDTFCLSMSGRLDWTRLALWLSLMLHRHGERIPRIKGFLHLEGADAPVLLNCVRHIAYFPEHRPVAEASGTSSFLVFIVDGLPQHLIARSFTACVGPASLASTPAQDEHAARDLR